jgi:thiamine-monophosphate kinase
MKLTGLDEGELVEAIRRDFGRKGKGLELGIGDDAAVLRSGSRKGERLLLTTDLLVEDVDFRRSIHPPFLLGRKSLSVNLSDIAAMGGRPRFALLGLALPRRSSPEWVNEFFRGFRSVGREAGLALIGGDLSGAEKIVISVTVMGAARHVVTRGGARPGDYLFVSGPLGDAAAGRRLLEKKGKFGPSLIPVRLTNWAGSLPSGGWPQP